MEYVRRLKCATVPLPSTPYLLALAAVIVDDAIDLQVRDLLVFVSYAFTLSSLGRLPLRYFIFINTNYEVYHSQIFSHGCDRPLLLSHLAKRASDSYPSYIIAIKTNIHQDAPPSPFFRYHVRATIVSPYTKVVLRSRQARQLSFSSSPTSMRCATSRP
jgi:hypothetical protein